MPSKDSAEPVAWLRRARQDLEAAQFLHANRKAAAVVAVQLQQAAEKALKALLLAHDRPVRRTHDLELLLVDAVEIVPELGRFADFCEKATAFYGFERYPTPFGSAIDEEDLDEALREAAALVEDIETRIL